MKGNTMATGTNKVACEQKPVAEPIDLAPMRHIDPENKNSVLQISREALAKNLKRTDAMELRAACATLEIPTTGKADVLRRRIIMRQCGGRMEYVASGTICAGCYNVVAITHTHEKYRRYKCPSCSRRGEIWNT